MNTKEICQLENDKKWLEAYHAWVEKGEIKRAGACLTIHRKIIRVRK